MYVGILRVFLLYVNGFYAILPLNLIFSNFHMIKKGAAHSMPPDLKKALAPYQDVLAKWNDLTPIQRNEWICWITIVKKPETRLEHIERAISEIKAGERQPCCWPGCPHRRPQAKKWFSPRKK